MSIKKASEAVSKVAASQLRAVTKGEALTTAGARSSTAKSLEPWKGWFQSFLKDNLGPERFQTFREWTNFMPDDIYDLQQSPKPSQKIPISKSDPSVSAMYRYPSPGSQKPPRMPEFELDEDPYDSGYFKRDTRRRHLSSELGDKKVEAAKLGLMNPNDPLVQEEVAKVESGPDSSPGNKGVFATGPSDFDPSGLRATMSASWEAVEESLDKYMPDHLPTPVWQGHEEEVIKFYRERGLPVPVGDYYSPLKTPIERRVATW